MQRIGRLFFLILGITISFLACNSKHPVQTDTDTVPTHHFSMTVTGMTCGNCAKSLKNMLSEQNGVIKAEVDHTSSSATIYYDPTVHTPEEMKQNLIKAIEEKYPTFKAS